MKFEGFQNSTDALCRLSEDLKARIDAREHDRFTLALSGGGTAKEMFEFWVREYAKSISWHSVLFFWVDERCVPPDSDESNFKHANELLLKPLKIKAEQIFRIRGEENPQKESERYSNLTLTATDSKTRIPDFDLTILGMGEDGHTASIFPQNLSLLSSAAAYAPSLNPNTRQMRVTMTGPCILNSHEIFMPVLGKAKESIMLRALEETKSGNLTLPGAYIMRNSQAITVFSDVLDMQISD